MTSNIGFLKQESYERMIEPQESREAELCVLGGCLRSSKALEIAFSVLVMEDFYHADCQYIFKTIDILQQSGITPDQVTVHQKLKDLNLLEEVNSPQILTDCISQTAPDYDISGCCRIVKEKSAKRQVVETCRNIAMSTVAPDVDASKVIEDARRMMNNLQVAIDPLSLSSLKHESKLLIDELEETTRTGIPPKLIQTGYKQLDLAFDGLMNFEMAVIVGMPGSGKSTLGLNILCNLCGGPQHLTGGILSLEMERSAYIKKIYAHEAVIPMQRFKRVMTPEEIGSLKAAQKYVDSWNLVIDDQRSVSVSGMIKKFKNMVNLHGVNFILIDYFQLLQNDSKENQRVFLEKASQAIFDFTREMHVPVIVLAQGNHFLLDKEREPDFDMIFGCSKLGKDADKLVFIRWTSKQNEQSISTVDLHQIKNRNGPTHRIIPMSFDGKHSRFTEMEHSF